MGDDPTKDSHADGTAAVTRVAPINVATSDRRAAREQDLDDFLAVALANQHTGEGARQPAHPIEVRESDPPAAAPLVGTVKCRLVAPSHAG